MFCPIMNGYALSRATQQRGALDAPDTPWMIVVTVKGSILGHLYRFCVGGNDGQRKEAEGSTIMLNNIILNNDLVSHSEGTYGCSGK